MENECRTHRNVKTSPETAQKKKPSIAPFDVMLGFVFSSIPQLRGNCGYFGA